MKAAESESGADSAAFKLEKTEYSFCAAESRLGALGCGRAGGLGALAHFLPELQVAQPLQPAQPPEQPPTAFAFFLLFRIEATTAATTASSIAPKKSVPQFCASHISISVPPVLRTAIRKASSARLRANCPTGNFTYLKFSFCGRQFVKPAQRGFGRTARPGIINLSYFTDCVSLLDSL